VQYVGLDRGHHRRARVAEHGGHRDPRGLAAAGRGPGLHQHAAPGRVGDQPAGQRAQLRPARDRAGPSTSRSARSAGRAQAHLRVGADAEPGATAPCTMDVPLLDAECMRIPGGPKPAPVEINQCWTVTPRMTGLSAPRLGEARALLGKPPTPSPFVTPHDVAKSRCVAGIG